MFDRFENRLLHTALYTTTKQTVFVIVLILFVWLLIDRRQKRCLIHLKATCPNDAGVLLVQQKMLTRRWIHWRIILGLNLGHHKMGDLKVVFALFATFRTKRGLWIKWFHAENAAIKVKQLFKYYFRSKKQSLVLSEQKLIFILLLYILFSFMF